MAGTPCLGEVAPKPAGQPTENAEGAAAAGSVLKVNALDVAGTPPLGTSWRGQAAGGAATVFDEAVEVENGHHVDQVLVLFLPTKYL